MDKERFKAIGLSYRTTPLSIRELVTFYGNESKKFLLQITKKLSINEILLLSTCNRTEIYYSSKTDLNDHILESLLSFKKLEKNKIASFIKYYEESEAIKQLFEVSLGLDSQVLGDIQISNQVKKAYQLSTDLGLAGPFLHRLLHTVFYANKRVSQETQLQDGTASLASVAVDLIKSFIPNLEKPRIALLGLGEIGQNVLENLNKSITNTIYLINRTKSKAEKFAKNNNVIVKNFSELENILQNSDVFISTISTKKTILNKSHLGKGYNHKLLIDLSIPRSLEYDMENVPGISLYNIDQLKEKTEEAKKIREQSVPEAKKIVSQSLDAFNKWKSEMEVSPTIKRLKNALDKIRKEEINRYSTQITSSEKTLIDTITKNMIQKVIKLPVLELKAACKRGEANTLVGILNGLFDLEASNTNEEH